jgi:hypothetical protein
MWQDEEEVTVANDSEDLDDLEDYEDENKNFSEDETDE